MAGTNQQFMNNTSVHKSPDERVSIGLDMLKYAGELLPVAMVEPDVWFVDVKAVGDICDNSTV